MDKKSLLLGIVIGAIVVPIAVGAGLITTSQIADYAITTAKIANSAVNRLKLANNAVTTSKLADNAVTSPKIAYQTIIKHDIAPSAITVTKIADGAVNTAKIANEAVTIGKLNADVTWLMPDWADQIVFNVDFPVISADSCVEQELTFPGAIPGFDTILATPVPTTLGVEDDWDTQWNAWVKASNIVTLRVCNNDSTLDTHNIAAQDWIIVDLTWEYPAP